MYVITTDQENRQYARLNDATKRADKLAETGGEHKVVHTETEAVVYVTSLAARAAAAGAYFNPWTRVETPKHVAPDFPGSSPPTPGSASRRPSTAASSAAPGASSTAGPASSGTSATPWRPATSPPRCARA